MRVYYSGSFWRSTTDESACDSILLNRSFQYGGYEWCIPNIYTCSQGMILDICRKIPGEVYETFYQKWSEIDDIDLPKEQLEVIKQENPMSFSILFEVTINGLAAQTKGWSAIGWQPGRLDFNVEEAENLMETYSLDRKAAWSIYRVQVTWPMSIRQDIKALSLKLSTDKVSHPCNVQFACKPGCEPFDVSFLHPINGESCMLHVYSCQQDKLPEHFLRDEEKEFPRCYCNLQYGTDPVFPADQFIMVQDCSKSDRPVVKAGYEGSVSKSVCSVGIIGGAEGTAYVMGEEKNTVKTKNVCSSMHFEPVQEVEWFISVQITPCLPKQINLIV